MMMQKLFRHMTAVFTLALSLVFAVPAAMASAEPYSHEEARNLAIVRTGMEAWRDGTGGIIDSLADEATWDITGNAVTSRIYTSKEDFLANAIRPFNARLSKPLVPTTVRDLYADGDTVVAFFDAEATARDGLPYRNTYAWFLTFRDGQIVKAASFFDPISFNHLWQRISP